MVVACVVAGLGIGVVASLLGVADGELLIPTLILLLGAEIKIAGSLLMPLRRVLCTSGIRRWYSSSNRTKPG